MEKIGDRTGVRLGELTDRRTVAEEAVFQRINVANSWGGHNH